jgi:hypothetical protein
MLAYKQIGIPPKIGILLSRGFTATASRETL